MRQEVQLTKGEIYSICLRGARQYVTGVDFDLSIYTPEYWDNPKYIANIITQQHFKFDDLYDEGLVDNYNPLIANAISRKKVLREVMCDYYDKFSTNEIVTILRFEIQ